MTLGSFLMAAGAYIIKKAAQAVTVIASANIENVAKAAVFVGVSAYTGYILVSNLIEKRRSWKNQSNMSTVDRALALNYADKENRKQLSPLFDEINRAFDNGPKKGRKKTLRKLTKQDIAELEKINRRISTIVPTYTEDGDYYYNTLTDDLDIFARDMKEVDRMERIKDRNVDDMTLWRIWNSPAY